MWKDFDEHMSKIVEYVETQLASGHPEMKASIAGKGGLAGESDLKTITISIDLNRQMNPSIIQWNINARRDGQELFSMGHTSEEK